MAEVILCIVVLLGFALIFKHAYDLDKRYQWFRSLKPGDMIQVEIFSDNCECYTEAMVISEPVNKYVEAQLSTDVKNECKRCRKANSSCHYEVTLFHRSSVSKII
jgi:hypothetical protein